MFGFRKCSRSLIRRSYLPSILARLYEGLADLPRKENHDAMANVRLFVSILSVSLCLSIGTFRAQAQMPTVGITGITTLQTCPSGIGFYTADPAHPATCMQGTISCPRTAPIGVTWSIMNPGGTQGTIVFFSGGGGVNAASSPGEEQAFVPAYVNAGYQVVQVAWGSPWEEANFAPSYSIRDAACRPASFLDYAHSHIYGPGGMCAQGASAGGAAIAYALTWYDASTFLDKAQMIVGPPLSDLQQGCQVPNNTAAQMCPIGQLGCNGWTQGPGGEPVLQSLEYTDHAGDVENWSGGTSVTGPACAQNTTTTYNANWLHMSIVDLSGYAGTPNFSYPSTAMSSWLCASDVQGTQNNSGSQGMLYYQQFTQPTQINSLQINAVTGCDDPEGIATGTPPPSWQLQGYTTAFAAISADMTAQTQPGRCTKRH
jgi:hypothetical protein